MTKILYPDFLENFDRYREVEQLWTDMLDRIATENNWSWNQWMEPVFSDGTPFFDGNPIFNAYVPEVDRGVRILQVEPEDSDEFAYYEDTVELTDGKTFPELVICLILTEETQILAEEVLRKWFAGEELEEYQV